MVAQHLPSAFVCLSSLSPTNTSLTRFQFWAVQLLAALITTVLEVLNQFFFFFFIIIEFFVSIGNVTLYQHCVLKSILSWLIFWFFWFQRGNYQFHFVSWDFLFFLFNLTEDEAKDTLQKVIEETLSKSGVKRSAVRAVCLGMSGVNHPKDKEKVLNWLRYEFFLRNSYLWFLHSFMISITFFSCYSLM